jgi:hypothetical protein
MGALDFKTLWNQAIRPALSAGAETIAETAAGKVVEIPEVQSRAIEASKSGIKGALSRGVDWVYMHPGKTAMYAGIPVGLIGLFIGYKVLK